MSDKFDEIENNGKLFIENIKEKKEESHIVSQFSKLGTKLLEDTEKPNIITLSDFEPFIPLFNADKERMKEDEGYRLHMNRLYNQYVRGLSINLYQPTIVIYTKENPVELYWLDRVYTRFQSDIVDGKSKREDIPSIIAKTANTTRDQILLEASLLDLMEANNTEKQKEYFSRIKIDSAIIQKKFVENNLSPDKREEMLKQLGLSDNPTRDIGENTTGMEFTLDDDDD